MGGFRQRFRVAFISILLGAWLLVVDGINFAWNFDEDLSDNWAKICLIISGFIFGILVIISACLILVDAQLKQSCKIIIIACLISFPLRLLSTLIGFKNFWKTSSLDRTSSGTTDIIIAGLQLYLIYDASLIYRNVNDYQPIYNESMNDSDVETSLNDDDITNINNDNITSAYDDIQRL